VQRNPGAPGETVRIAPLKPAHVAVAQLPVKNRPETGGIEPATISHVRRLVLRSRAAAWLRFAKMTVGFVWPKCTRAPFVPSPLAGEGTTVWPRTPMGEGVLATNYPSPIIARGSIEQPSPARGEGTIMATALVALLTMSNSPSRCRGAFLRPGVCIFASLTPIEGWAERRETFGCVRDTRWTCHDAGRSPLGAPPWRFWAGGRASVSGITPDPCSELLAARS
jgi:hypothetical protein